MRLVISPSPGGFGSGRLVGITYLASSPTPVCRVVAQNPGGTCYSQSTEVRSQGPVRGSLAILVVCRFSFVFLVFAWFPLFLSVFVCFVCFC